MLSAKVIIAIEVLLRLKWEQPDQRIASGKDLSDLLESIGVHKSTCMAVLRQLMQSGYIVIAGRRNCFVALRDPSQINVLQLVQLFHGDPCIGELYDHRKTLGRVSLGSQTDRNVIRYERRLNQQICGLLENMPITKFRETTTDATPL